MSRPKLKDLLKKKEIEPGKSADLEKNDFIALLIACASVFLPVVIGVCIVLFLFIWGWVSFFG